jgi:hypothetical protein
MNLKLGSKVSLSINWAHVAAVLTFVVGALGQYVQSGSIDLTQLGPWGGLVALVISLLAKSILVPTPPLPAPAPVPADLQQKGPTQ